MYVYRTYNCLIEVFNAVIKRDFTEFQVRKAPDVLEKGTGLKYLKIEKKE
jgi:hypothetical protein